MKTLVCLFITLFCILQSYALLAQSLNNYSVKFHPVFGSLELEPGNNFIKINDRDSLRIETLKFYISNIQFIENNVIVWKEENSFHLLDASIRESMSIELKIPAAVKFNKIKFTLGIDSTTNVAGVIGGDLDPTRGMYWTWQSGYINFKMEGKSNVCKTRNNEFDFHIGGYQSPFNTIQSVLLDTGNNRIIDITIECKKLIDSIDLSKQNHIMSPCIEAVELSDKIAKIFIIK